MKTRNSREAIASRVNVTAFALLPEAIDLANFARLLNKEVNLLDGQVTALSDVDEDGFIYADIRIGTFDFPYLKTNLRSLFEGKLGLTEWDWDVELPKRLRKRGSKDMRQRKVAGPYEELQELRELSSQQEDVADKIFQEAHSLLMQAVNLVAGPKAWTRELLDDPTFSSEVLFELAFDSRNEFIGPLLDAMEVLKKAAGRFDDYRYEFTKFSNLDEQVADLSTELKRLEKNAPAALDYMNLTE